MTDHKESLSVNSSDDIIRFFSLLFKYLGSFFSMLFGRLFYFLSLILFLLRKNYILALLFISLGAFLGWFFKDKLYPPFTYKITLRANFESAPSLYSTIEDWNNREIPASNEENISGLELYPVKSQADMMDLYYTSVKGKDLYFSLDKLISNPDGLPIKYKDFSKKVDRVNFKDHVLLIHTQQSLINEQNFQKMLIERLNEGSVLSQKNANQKDILKFEKRCVEDELDFLKKLLRVSESSEKTLKEKGLDSTQDNYITIATLYQKATDKLVAINNEISHAYYSIEPISDLRLVKNKSHDLFRGMKQGILMSLFFLIAALLFHRFFIAKEYFCGKMN